MSEYIRRQKGYIYQEEQPGLGTTVDIIGWYANYVGKGMYQVVPNGPGADRCMTMTGNAVTLLAHIPINHRLVRFEWKHTDGSYVDSAVATAVTFQRHDYEPVYANLWWTLYSETASTAATTVVPYGEGYEYVSTDYLLTFTTTNGHFIFPKLWIQEVKP